MHNLKSNIRHNVQILENLNLNIFVQKFEINAKNMLYTQETWLEAAWAVKNESVVKQLF